MPLASYIYKGTTRDRGSTKVKPKEMEACCCCKFPLLRTEWHILQGRPQQVKGVRCDLSSKHKNNEEIE